ncbi:acyl CoA:diacylglycerol acyltransferase, putative [Plasmodium gallinaceum]|uniref:Acyl CoA:diacylglycerol acyltransferase, putative n=1 Tax=Plasmodium gallinaceum TaxID=5849 RepID=A0A1J1GRQ5_PLAGA|nr:acyl CoA:diacylglycerol acyltransferase, putative [Plasmodium gallinaceum]CRG93976.1 acyl CoA:diacylglycerol acyltransferase, putative [Plasmodium gallinaceum]
MKIRVQSNTISEIEQKYYIEKLYVNINNDNKNNNDLNKHEKNEVKEQDNNIQKNLYTPSHLDIFDNNSPIMSSNFCGFGNLILNMGLFFSLIMPLLNFMEKGYFLDTSMHSYLFTNLEYAKRYPDDYFIKYKIISLKNYINFMICPSLIYKFNFKRIKKFRPKYFVQKITSLLLTVIIEYTTFTVFIAPTIYHINNISFFEAIIRLIFPCLIIFLVTFYMIFECICNLFAEITKFGEREFYQDWWNSTIWYEFSRKWNNVVQVWLFKHVYLVAKNNYKIACFHTCKFYLFFLMFLQFPLSWLGEHFYKNKPIGNIIFWSNILLGLPLIFISYANEIK